MLTRAGYIHSELYKRYAPEHVSAVAHVHTESLLPFGLAPKLPFKAMVRTSGFLGHAPAPVFDIADQCVRTCCKRDARSFGTETDLLIRSPAIGAQLARAFEPRVEEPPTTKTEKKKSGLFSRNKKPVEEPVTSVVKPRNLVLQRGHGATIVAPSLKLAVQRAIYADKVREDRTYQRDAHRMHESSYSSTACSAACLVCPSTLRSTRASLLCTNRRPSSTRASHKSTVLGQSGRLRPCPDLVSSTPLALTDARRVLSTC